MNYEPRDLILMSIDRKQLSRLFAETMSDKTQKVLRISNDITEIAMSDLVSNITPNDLLCTANDYDMTMCDFSIIDSNGKILFTSNEDGSTINNLHQEEFRKEDNLQELIEIYNRVRKAENIYTIYS